MTFYDCLIELCKKRGTTPASVARDIGLSNSATTYWKRGSVPKYETLKKLADYFGVSVDDLTSAKEHAAAVIDHMRSKLAESDAPVTPPQKHTFTGTAELYVTANVHKRKMDEAFDRLNPTGQEKAAERVEELAKIPDYQRPKPPSEGS